MSCLHCFMTSSELTVMSINHIFVQRGSIVEAGATMSGAFVRGRAQGETSRENE
jgi:hypothetical protein